MLTSFFGSRSFGGDAAYVERLSAALLRAGHDVDVVHCADAFRAVRGRHPLRAHHPPRGLRTHTLASPVGTLSALWTHQVGTPGPKTAPLRSIVRAGAYDVVHLHNVSLVGGPGLLEVVRSASATATVLMSAHEYWLVCPKSTLWRFERELCTEPRCAPCSVHARRPPQLWRHGDRLGRFVDGLDELIVPSEAAASLLFERGIGRPLEVLPYFIPSDWAGARAGGPNVADGEPTLVAAGRLVPSKGFESLLEAMRRLPDVRLVIAGTGPGEAALRRLARTTANVTVAGLLEPPALASLYRSATALVVPSLWPEPFGYVVLEAASVGVPAIVRGRGALPELARTGGGLVYEGEDELVRAVRSLVDDPERRRSLASRALAAAASEWSESVHVGRYLDLLAGVTSRLRRPQMSQVS